MPGWIYRLAAVVTLGSFLSPIPVAAQAAGLYADVVVYNGKILALNSAGQNHFRTVPAGAFGVLSGDEVDGEPVVPFRRLIDAGHHPVMELDRHGFHPFLALQIAINRKDQNGKIWDPKQRVSGTEALYTYTQWTAEYLIKENYIGSIEPGEAGDLIDLEGDDFTALEDEIGQIDAVLTGVAGNGRYSDAVRCQLRSSGRWVSGQS